MKFCLLQTFVETGRALNRRVLRLFSHFRVAALLGEAPAASPVGPFVLVCSPGILGSTLSTLGALWEEIWVMLKPCKGWGLLITTDSND